MILIWSGDGGPLQYLGLAIFFLQFFAPQIFRLTVDVRDGTVHVDSFHLLWVLASVAIAIFMGGLWVVWDWCTAQQQQEERELDDNVDAGRNAEATGTNDGTSAAAAALPADPPAATGGDESFWQGVMRGMSLPISPAHLLLALGFLLPLAFVAPLLLNGMVKEGGGGLAGMLADSGVVQITVLAVAAHSMMAIAAYRVLRDVLEGGVGPYPGNQRGGGRRRRWRKLTVGEISDIVRKVPVEEFVSPEDIKSGECSVARMKRMLVNRGEAEAADRCMEKDDLVKEVERVRKFNEECAICAEEYIEGDVLRVPHCQHEFHLHCFDKWIYTFATDSRPVTDPTCPLCKATLH